MEACMMKPVIKKKPKPPKPPPKPTEVKRNEAEKDVRPVPLIPPRPSDALNGDIQQPQPKLKPSEGPVAPPRRAEKEPKAAPRHGEVKKTSKETDQPQVPAVEIDFKAGLTGIFRRSQKEKLPTFTSYMTDDLDPEEKSDGGPIKQVPSNKPTSREPSPDPSSQKEQLGKKNKEQHNAEHKQDKGGILSGMFRKTPKERSSSPALKDSKADMESEDVEKEAEEEDEEKTSEPNREKGGFFSGILKKSSKAGDESSIQENLSNSGELSASSDSLSDNKEKGGIFSGIFRKSPKPAETDQDQRSLSGDLSGSNDNLTETKDKGFFNEILRKSPKITGEGKQEQENEVQQSDLSASSENLSENVKEKGNVLSGMFRRSPKPSEGSQLEEGEEPLNGELSASNDSLSENKEKGGFFGLLRKTPKSTTKENLTAHKEVSGSSDSLSEAASRKEKKTQDGDLSSSEDPNENPSKEKGRIFGGMFKKTPKAAGAAQPEEDVGSDPDVSASNENLCDNKPEKGGLFSGFLKKTPKGEKTETPDREAQTELSASREDLAENNKEKGGIFSGIFRKTPKFEESAQSEEDVGSDPDVSASNENLCDNKPEKGGLFSGFLKKTPKGEKTETPDREAQTELSASREDLAENNKEKNIFSNMFKKTPKPASEEAKGDTEADTERPLSASSENLTETTSSKEKKGGLAGIFKRSSSFDNLLDEDKNIFSGMFKKTPKSADEGSHATGDDMTLSGSSEDLLQANATKEKTGGFAGIFKKSPKPSPRSAVTQDPLSDSKELSASWDSLTEAGKEDASSLNDLSASTDNLSETSTKEKRGGFSGMFRRTPKNLEQQDGEDTAPPTGRGLSRKRTIKKKRRVVSFRIKKTLPKMSKENSSKMPLIEESVELEELNTSQESTVLMEPVEMAAYPAEETQAQEEQENNELMEWWNSVKGWTEWNETSNFQEEDEQMAMEQAADRVYMAARVFVYLFNQRGASLQQRILELLAVADAADEFHKKTVSAAVGGGVASVAGSVATITGLILAPFTFGASIIVTAVGIGVATAGSITSATANITDTVHSNMDRKKVEKMIQGYQEEIQDIRKCMEFVQEGMNTLEEWDFEKYSESAAKKALNHNIKHVMKEGGRAGKALMINTDKLISTVQVLGAAGGAAKAAQAISVTTGVMSALFLALDVFFLAKDSHELRKGAKTKFAGKIRQVCKDLQDGLLELNKVKTQLQKTMDGIEVEEYEEIEEVEVEVEDELESDPKKLAELEQEIDFLEEKLNKKEDKKEEVEPKKSKETALDIFKIKKEKKEEKNMKETGEMEEKEKDEKMSESKSEKKKGNESGLKTVKEAIKEQFEKGSKKEKEAENQTTAGKEKKAEKKSKETNEMPENKKRPEKEKEAKIKASHSEKEKTSQTPHAERETSQKKTERRRNSEEEEERKSESGRRHSNRSEKGERKEETGSHHGDRESWRRRGEEERGVKDWRAEMEKSRRGEEKYEGERGDHSQRKGSHRSHKGESVGEDKKSHYRGENDERRERGEEKSSSRVESARKMFESAAGEQQEERGSQRRRAGGREQGQSRRGSRSKYDALKHDGLNI
ncbi:uncharacterized protein LOC119779898 isoform X2 [Cyprinodon tularosa]|uniref:uncharacterized protein LOC119779898 isoform X2 n=1 Tax=Cyprinodon tularosa TaxID=77115 RepID=UPI0018E27E65|nr:uncharacterized protein LOC119779898 isoform X2 [Cyprinodon tularosa]